MRITKLCLTNFKSFKQRQVINFSAVTLLFGPNSVGKSSIILALFYLNHILTKGQCNPIQLEGQGGKAIGGFRNLVNGRDLSKSIVIEVEYINDGVGSEYVDSGYNPDEMPDGPWDLDPFLSLRLADRVNVKLTVSWSVLRNTAYIASVEIGLDGIELLEAVSDISMRGAIISRINYLHPCLEPAFLVKRQTYSNNYLYSTAGIDEEDYDELFPIGGCASFFHEQILLEDDYSKIPLHKDAVDTPEHLGMRHTPIAFGSIAGALPVQDKLLDISRDFRDKFTRARFSAILSNMLVAPIDDLSAILRKSLCIGPIRIIPSEQFQPNPYPSQGDWHDGRAAWDILAQGNSKLLRDVSDWMSSADKLNLGYGISLKVEKRISEFKKADGTESFEQVDEKLSKALRDGRDGKTGIDRFDRYVTEFGYEIWDEYNKIEVMPNAIGVGISQLLPLVVAGCMSGRGLISIEQPELHVHPRIQVAIGDLLTQIDRDSTFLIETHSEHLILRILKRIRQTTDGELPDGYIPVKPDDISITYLEPSEDGVKARRIAVDNDGDFQDRWPDGFFSERREEFL